MVLALYPTALVGIAIDYWAILMRFAANCRCGICSTQRRRALRALNAVKAMDGRVVTLASVVTMTRVVEHVIIALGDNAFLLIRLGG